MSDEKSAEPGKRRRRRRRKAPGAESAPSATRPDNRQESAKPEGAKTDASKRRRSAKPSNKRTGSRDRGRRDAPAEREQGRSTAAAQAPRPRRASRGSEDKPSTQVPAKEAQAPREARPAPAPIAAAPAVSPSIRWGDDSDAPTKDIAALPADLPANAPQGDWDPNSAHLLEQAGFDGELGTRICNVIGVRFVPAGRLYLFDGGEGNYDRGDRVVVEAERGERIGTVGAQSSRQAPPRSLKRVLRRAAPLDTTSLGQDSQQEHLATAKALAKQMALGIKVFRAQVEQGRLAIYYSCEDKTDVRRLTRALSDALPLPVELRHHGVRDEAKLVGGIGSCGLELCCSTWLPAFVPVSIKNAKDQGLVLNPTKVSGQCGRLKCCLVYEQAQYAEMRKGLPKLGKRVITNDGIEGRVIEVDVLHQRFRVSIGRGESKIYQKGEVEPMFASQAQGQDKGGSSKSGSRQPKPQGFNEEGSRSADAKADKKEDE